MTKVFGQWSVKYRPKSLEDVIENEKAVTKAKNIIKNHNAHAILLHGPTGCGKTTIARLIANGLTSVPSDITEKNVSDERGIDFVRGLIKSSQYKPAGKYKVYILDECFLGSTPVATPNGNVPISEISVGEKVYTNNGMQKVTNVFKKKVPLSHLQHLTFSDNSELLTTFKHEVFTKENDWVEARFLNEKTCQTLQETMLMLRKEVYTKSVKSTKLHTLSGTNSFVQNMWKVIQAILPKTPFKKFKEASYWMLPIPQYANYGYTRSIDQEIKIERTVEKNKERFKEVPFNGGRCPREGKNIQTYDREQPYIRSESGSKSNKNKFGEIRRDRSRSPTVSERWERQSIPCRSIINYFFTQGEDRVRCFFGKTQERLPNSLQVGHGLPLNTIGDRIGRLVSRFKNRQEKRSEKGSSPIEIRVESSSIFQSNCGKESTKSSKARKEIIKEVEESTNNGYYVTMYDIEVEHDHCYFVQPKGSTEHILVHNCHALLGQSQSTILKTLEEPEHEQVVWILCTNRHTMLTPEFLNRLYKIGVEKPSEKSLASLLYKVTKKEKAFTRFDEKKRKRICLEVAKISDRVPREALQILQEIHDSEAEYTSFKDLVITGIKQVAEKGIDALAMQVLMAIYSPDKSANEKAQFLVHQLFEKDMWALTIRLCTIHQHLFNYVAGIRGGPAYYYVKELQPHNAVTANLRLLADVGSKLVEIRNNLQTLNANPPEYVVPALVNIVYSSAKHVNSK